MILYILIGFLAGIVSGMGIGGGTILIPALSVFFSVGQQQAQNINLLYFIPTAVIALITHRKKGNIEKGAIWKVILWGLIGAGLGSWLALGVDETLLRRLFGGLLLVMGARELFGKYDVEKGNDDKEGGEYSGKSRV